LSFKEVLFSVASSLRRNRYLFCADSVLLILIISQSAKKDFQPQQVRIQGSYSNEW